MRHYPDRFPGFLASLPMNEPEVAAREADRALGELGAAGLQVHTNINGLPLDDPRFLPVFARHDRPVLLIGVPESIEMSDSKREQICFRNAQALFGLRA